jgi:hypothetical protein
VDSTAQALAYLATVENGWLTFARNELERVKGRAG